MSEGLDKSVSQTPEGNAYWLNFQNRLASLEGVSGANPTQGRQSSDEASWGADKSASAWQPSGRQPDDPRVIKYEDHEMPVRRLE